MPERDWNIRLRETQSPVNIPITESDGSNPLCNAHYDYLDDGDRPRRLDSGDQALIPPASDCALYALLAVIGISVIMLFGASAYALLS